MNTAKSPVSVMDKLMLGQEVLQKHINKEPSNVSLIFFGQVVLRRYISKEPSNVSLMCSPFSGQVVLRKDISKGAK